ICWSLDRADSAGRQHPALRHKRGDAVRPKLPAVCAAPWKLFPQFPERIAATEPIALPPQPATLRGNASATLTPAWHRGGPESTRWFADVRLPKISPTAAGQLSAGSRVC